MPKTIPAAAESAESARRAALEEQEARQSTWLSYDAYLAWVLSRKVSQ